MKKNTFYALLYVAIMLIVGLLASGCTKSDADPQPVSIKSAEFTTTIPGIAAYTGAEFTVGANSQTADRVYVDTGVFGVTITGVGRIPGNYQVLNWKQPYSGGGDVITVYISGLNKLYYSTTGSLVRSATGFDISCDLVEYCTVNCSGATLTTGYKLTGSFKY